jgi:hypothetical protein
VKGFSPQWHVVIWNRIELIHNSRRLDLPAPYSSMFLVKIPQDNSHWLVGAYNNLTKFAKDLRIKQDLREILTEERVRDSVSLNTG